MKSKNIVFVIDRLSTGGAERVTAALANEICKINGYRVYVITYAEKEDKEYYLTDEVIRYDIPKPGYSRFKTILYKHETLQRMLAEIQPYCVCSLTIPKTNVILTAACDRKKYPVILSERNDPERFPTEKIIRYLRDKMYRECDGLVFQTDGAKNYFCQKIQDKSVVISNPITARLPEAYHGVREHKIVNFCRIEPQKNILMLIKAFEIISGEFNDYTLEFWGDGSQKSELQKYVVSSGLSDRVIFHGYSSNVHEEIVKASLFVSSSDFEGISNSMIEAMAIGLPVICTDCPPGGARMTIRDGYNGRLVPVGDEKKLAETMKELLVNREEMDRLSLNASKLRVDLRADVISEKWIEFIEEVRKIWESKKA